MQPTIILAHGAFADSSSWGAALTPLAAEGFDVMAWAGPLRGIAEDAAALAALVPGVEGPIVLVGHPYGGAVVTDVAPEAGHNIPLGAHRVMAQRASTVNTSEVPGASHVVGISHADRVVEVIRHAARAEAPTRA
jgi:predicted alpha/beta-hydrolase family hydrolase